MSSNITYIVGIAETIHVEILQDRRGADIRGHTFVATFTNIDDDQDVVVPNIVQYLGMSGIYIETDLLVDDAKIWNYQIVGTDTSADEYLVLDGQYKP